ncbi:MAG: ATP-dependent zinc metalloprotease FtsH [Nitrospiraceae bacterium]|nr:ATP-dependent zinc metalloprotease FtsH [Nitrospiraceae bacterium]
MEDDKKDSDKLKSLQWRWLWALLFLFMVLYVFQSFSYKTEKKAQTITYSSFLAQLEGDNIKSVVISGLDVTGELNKPAMIVPQGGKQQVSVTEFKTYLPVFQGQRLIDKLRAKNVSISVVPAKKSSAIMDILVGVLPWVLIIGVWVLLMRRTAKQISGGPGGLFSFGESKAKLFQEGKTPKVTFKDVAGMENTKRELLEIIEFLKDPGKYRTFGAKVPKGVLLVGPPGTGKTLLARAVAGEAGVPFYSISASEFIEMFVGVGAARVRDLFKKAKASQPSIIFIDEIDAVGRTRGAGLGGGHDEREQTLNQLLGEMDGFEPHEAVIIMAATNRPDVLDPALLRPGRFDRHIVIDRPGLKERKAIMEIHVRDKTLAPDVDLEKVARGTTGMTGADLENLANEAALIAVRKNKPHVEMKDFDEARDIILMGTVREETISQLERRITAYHESGHALVAWELPGTDPIHKVSILPRGMAMGVTQLLPEEDRHYYPRSYLMNKLAVALGGRVAEKLVFNDVSTGAQNDLKEATELAEKMVAQWGMSEKVGPVNLGRAEEHPFLGRELAQPKRYSEGMAWLMDREIRNLVEEAQAGAEKILSGKKDTLDRLAEGLLKEESLDYGQIEKIIGSPKRKPELSPPPASGSV